MSADRGLETVYMADEAINAWHYERFLRKLRRCNGLKPLCVYMDNLQVHRAKHVKPLYA